MSGFAALQAGVPAGKGDKTGLPVRHRSGQEAGRAGLLGGLGDSVNATGTHPPPSIPWSIAGISVLPASVMQTKLIIGSASDPLEREADAVADRVMQMDRLAAAPPAPPVPSGGAGTATGKAMGKVLCSTVGPTSSAIAAPPIVQEVLHSSGLPLDQTARQFMEPRFGHDFSRVRIFTDAKAAESAKQIGARAYTVGNNVVFGQGHYAPDTSAGRRLLAHELSHTLQQAQSGELRLQRAETDDSPSQCAGLKNAASKVNELVNARLEEARKAAPSGYEKDGDMHRAFLDDAKKRLSDMEQKVHWLPEAHRFTFLGRATLDGTKYQGAEGLNQKPGELSAIVNIGGVCVGADKFGHFFEDGWSAFKAADRKAALLQSGDDEITLQGLGNTGVFSNADIAANLAGRKFYEELDKNPQMQFKAESYFTGRMNEGVNQSYYTEDLGKVVWKNLLERNWTGTAQFDGYEKDLTVTFRNVDMKAGTLEGDYQEQIVQDGSDPWNQTLIMTGKIYGDLALASKEVQGATKKANAIYGLSMTVNLDMAGGPDRVGSFASEGERLLTGNWSEEDSGSAPEKGTWSLRSG